MRISIISPILSPENAGVEGDFRKDFRLRDCAGIPADFDFHYIDQGPAFILSDDDDAMAVPHLLRKATALASEGTDAIVINCSADTGLRLLRESLSIPVIGPTEASMLYAPQLVDRICVLTFSQLINARFERMADALGLRRYLDLVHSVETPFESISNGASEIEDKLFSAICSIRAERGCDGFVLGCTDFEDVAPGLSEKLRAAGIAAVVLKPFEIAVWQAYITVAMGLARGGKRRSMQMPPLRP